MQETQEFRSLLDQQVMSAPWKDIDVPIG
jgi:hypothetical protein